MTLAVTPAGGGTQTIKTLDDVVAAAGSPSSNVQTVQGVSGGTPIPVNNSASIFWNGATGAGSALTASATFTGSSRDSGAASGAAQYYAYFNAFFSTDQAGTARIDGSNDNSTWYTVATSALAANTPLILSVPVLTRYHRAVVVNGSTNQTFLWVNSSYTGA
jgi:hypothetical protein